MYFRIVRKDILKSKLIAAATLLFIAAAAALVSLAALLAVNLLGAVDTLMAQAETPHFMQMHSGAVNEARLNEFAADNEAVEEFQILDFLNLDGAEISIGEPLADRGAATLASSVQDNGISRQSDRFDYLLDLDGRVINPSEGQLYVPLCYLKDGTARLGDRAVICGKEFTVAGFLRDSQMNSSLSSSKRFLVSDNDYEALKPRGNVEYLIEFRLKDLAGLSEFEAAYTAAGLEANGPAVTCPLFRMINAMSDGMMIAVVLFAGILTVGIALLCIRFTLLAKLEDDYREIGVMKAVGLRTSDIKKIYLAKYAFLAAAGCLLGYAASFVFTDSLSENIRLFLGESENAGAAPYAAAAGVFLVFLGVTAFVNLVLRRFRKISAAAALRSDFTDVTPSGRKGGNGRDGDGGRLRLRLVGSRLFSTTVFLGLQDVMKRKKLYSTMLAVLTAAAFIIIVPQNLYSTLSSREFITYMGIGRCDLRFDLQQTEGIGEKTEEIAAALRQDETVSQIAVLTTKAYTARLADGSEERIKVELGDHSVFPVSYSEGTAPSADDEIALSAMNADELNKKVGDSISLTAGETERQLKVCGIYSDITNGGRTAKAAFRDDSQATMWSVICAELADSTRSARTAEAYGSRFSYAKVSDVEEYAAQTFGPTIRSVETASRAAAAAALLITALVTLLFVKLLTAKDRRSVAVLKALGFTSGEIGRQYAVRALAVSLLGILLGTVLANTLGESAAGAVIASFGAADFRFAVNPLSAYVLCPLLMLLASAAAAAMGASGVRGMKLSKYIRE